MSYQTPTLRSLPVDKLFRFRPGGPVYEYRGNGWHARPAGHDGGPWHLYGDPEVYPLSQEEEAEVRAKADAERERLAVIR